MRTSRPTLTLLVAFAALGGLLGSANAQSVATQPVGAVSVTALANSDSNYSVALVRPSAFEGVVSSKAGNVFTFSGTPFAGISLQYSAGVQANTYYAQIGSGVGAGHYATVIANADSTITCEFEADVLANIAVGDKIVIRPYWTMGTLFAPSQAGVSFVASTSNLSSGRRTEILIPDLVGTGINKSPSATYFYNGFWRKVGDVTPNRNDTIILPDSYVTVRGNNYSSNTVLTVVGSVLATDHVYSMLSLSGTARNDNPFGLILPVDKALGSIDILSSFVASTNNLSSGRGDELLVFDNSVTGKNKSPSATYFYNGFWRKVGDVSANQNATVLPSSAAIVIRKKGTTVSSVTDWKSAPVAIVN